MNEVSNGDALSHEVQLGLKSYFRKKSLGFCLPAKKKDKQFSPS